MRPNKKLAKIFRDAALLYLHDGIRLWPTYPEQKYSCLSVYEASPSDHMYSKAVNAYNEYFNQHSPTNRAWFHRCNYSTDEDMQEHRCLCLLLMAEIFENHRTCKPFYHIPASPAR